MTLALAALSFIGELFKLVGPDVQKIIAAWVQQHREAVELLKPGWAERIEDEIKKHDDAGATDLANRVREGAAGH